MMTPTPPPAPPAVKAHARMIAGDDGITDPIIQLIITPHENDVFEKVGMVDVHLDANNARTLGYYLLGLSSEADSQRAYILALRSIKEDEEQIMALVREANKMITARRGFGV